MKKSIVYIALVAVVILAVGFIVMRQTAKQEAYQPLKERTAKLAVGDEWTKTKTLADNLFTQLNQNKEAKTTPDTKTLLKLAEIYIQEGRITGDHLYYDQAAMKLVDDALAIDSASFEALSYKSMIYLSGHHFTEGLEYATKAQQANPYNAFVYGLLTDAHLELGNYDEAVKMADKMVSIRPDLRSYSRVSYLREVYGDYPGAIDAMKLAVAAGYPSLEETEWARVQLGHLYEYTGNIDSAKLQYLTALAYRPDYPYAYAGLARLEQQQKNYAAAINYYLMADSIVDNYTFQNELIDLYAESGDTKKMEETLELVLDKLNKHASEGTEDNDIGHYADLELAYVYVKTNDFDKAQEHALREWNRRPGNIDVNELLGWIYLKTGKMEDALKHIDMALKTGSQNPMLMSRAAIIYFKAGDIEKAKQYKELALKNKPNYSPSLQQELTATVGAADMVSQ
ncbi:hypothetical protein BH09BAC1_BH09BAC1_05460 [soil metagenome]